MAIQTGILPFTGKLGNVIGYKRGNKYCLRSMPQTVHQSARTKLSGRAFGKASTLGAAIRHALSAPLQALSAGGTVNRLNKALLTVLHTDDLHHMPRFIPRHFNSLAGFSFNPHASLPGVLPVTPNVRRDADGNIIVTLPAITRYEPPAGITHLSVRAVAVHVKPGFLRAEATMSDTMLIELGRPSDPAELVMRAGKGVLSCVVLEVVSCREEEGRVYRLRNRKHTAVQVIAVLPGKVARIKRRRHKRPPATDRLMTVPGLQVNFCRRE